MFVCFTFVLQRVIGSSARQFHRRVTERYSPKNSSVLPLCYRGLQVQVLVYFVVVILRVIGSTRARLFHLCVTVAYRLKCSSVHRCGTEGYMLFHGCVTEVYGFNKCSSVSPLRYTGL